MWDTPGRLWSWSHFLYSTAAKGETSDRRLVHNQVGSGKGANEQEKRRGVSLRGLRSRPGNSNKRVVLQRPKECVVRNCAT